MSLTDEEFEKMLEHMVEFFRAHGHKVTFSGGEEITPENFGIIETELTCECKIVFGLTDDRTYHLHSLIYKDEETGEETVLFEV